MWEVSDNSRPVTQGEQRFGLMNIMDDFSTCKSIGLPIHCVLDRTCVMLGKELQEIRKTQVILEAFYMSPYVVSHEDRIL